MSNPLAPNSLAGKAALVTGSSRGIGADTVGYFAEAGASVLVNYRNKEARALKIVSSIVEKGGKAIAFGADLTDATQVAAMFDAAESAFGKLDILVMNASGGMEAGMGEDTFAWVTTQVQSKLMSLPSPRAREPRSARMMAITEPQADKKRDPVKQSWKYAIFKDTVRCKTSQGRWVTVCERCGWFHFKPGERCIPCELPEWLKDHFKAAKAST